MARVHKGYQLVSYAQPYISKTSQNGRHIVLLVQFVSKLALSAEKGECPAIIVIGAWVQTPVMGPWCTVVTSSSCYTAMSFC